jgi:hypothetical protein
VIELVERGISGVELVEIEDEISFNMIRTVSSVKAVF